MMVEANPAPSAEERVRARALDTLKTRALEAILVSDEPVRTVDAARAVADALEIDLNEEELGGLASLVRIVLDSDTMFSQANRQWDLAVRMGRAEADRRKPVERAVEDFIDLIGRPVPPSLVASLVSAVYGRDPEYYQKMIERLAPTRPQFFLVSGNQVAISRWLPDISSDDPEEVEWDNFEDPTYLNALRPVAQGVEAADAVSFARQVVERAGEPVNVKTLLFLTWSAFPDSDPASVFKLLYATGSLHLVRGPAWVTDAGRGQVLDAIRTLTQDPETAAGMLAAAMPAEEEERESVFPTPTIVRVSDDDLNQVYDFMSPEPRTFRVSELCQQVLEAFPGSRTYSDIYDSLRNRMNEDGRFRWVGTERFRTAGSVPAEVEVLPEGLAYDEGEYLGEEGVEIDKAVEPRDWKFTLDEQIAHYQVQDLGDDQTRAGTAPARLDMSAPLHHYVAGTYYLRDSDAGFFPSQPDIVQVSLLTSDGGRFDVWVNNRLGLIFGLKEWYDANLPFVGGLFHIEPTSQPDEFRLLYSGETDPLMDIPMERLQTLLMLRAEASNEGLPLTEIATRLIKGHTEPVHFVTLFTEINVVRRVRRAQVASILSSQRYFTQAPSQPGYWFYDEKRAAKATRKKGGPRRPMREMLDDEDDEFEIE